MSWPTPAISPPRSTRRRRCASARCAIAGSCSWIEQGVAPPIPGPVELPPVMQAKRPVHPEFHPLGFEAKAGPIGRARDRSNKMPGGDLGNTGKEFAARGKRARLIRRSEEHTSELQSQ